MAIVSTLCSGNTLRNGAVVAALSISGPSFRLGPDYLMSEIVPLVTAAADRLSRYLGHRTH